jgi:hypothetical protein
MVRPHTPATAGYAAAMHTAELVEAKFAADAVELAEVD